MSISVERPAEAGELLSELVPGRAIFRVGPVRLHLAASQYGGWLRLGLAIHHDAERAGYLRLRLTATRGRRWLGARLPGMAVDLPPGTLLLARADVPLLPIHRFSSLRLGLSGRPRFSPPPRWRLPRWSSKTLDRLRLRLSRLRWGPGAVVELRLQPVAAGDCPDPLDHRPAWHFCCLWADGEPRDLTELRTAYAAAMRG